MERDAINTDPRDVVEETGCSNCSESVVCCVVEITSSILNGIIYHDCISRY